MTWDRVGAEGRTHAFEDLQELGRSLPWEDELAGRGRGGRGSRGGGASRVEGEAHGLPGLRAAGIESWVTRGRLGTTGSLSVPGSERTRDPLGRSMRSLPAPLASPSFLYRWMLLASSSTTQSLTVLKSSLLPILVRKSLRNNLVLTWVSFPGQCPLWVPIHRPSACSESAPSLP